jgi:thiol-disulfide isomerase/thioredoxin
MKALQKSAGVLGWTFILLIAMAMSVTSAQAESPLDFELEGLDGGTYQLSAYRGQWVVVNYWATWCAPCRKEIPDLSRLHDRRSDLVVLGLAFEDTEPADLLAFLEEYPATYPILLVDTFNPPEDLGAPRALPTTWLVDFEGHIVETWIGPVTGEMIEDRIAELDAESSGA